MSESDPDPRAAMNGLVPLVYDELRRVARHYFSRQPPGFTLRPTDMVNEACIHLMQHSQVEWKNAEHFRAIAAKKIWQVVVDHLKRRSAGKRGGAGRPKRGQPNLTEPADSISHQELVEWQRIPLEKITVEWPDRTVDLLDLAEALEALAAESGRLRDVVTLHWFGGLKYAEVARHLGVSVSTVEKDFRYALAWLNRKLEGTESDGD